MTVCELRRPLACLVFLVLIACLHMNDHPCFDFDNSLFTSAGIMHDPVLLTSTLGSVVARCADHRAMRVTIVPTFHFVDRLAFPCLVSECSHHEVHQVVTAATAERAHFTLQVCDNPTSRIRRNTLIRERV